MTLSSPLPRVIQGGMGVAVSDWRFANAVGRTGQLGVVSGSMLDTAFVQRLQDGDPGGHLRRTIAAFPDPEVSEEILRRYFAPDGRADGTPYKNLPMYKQRVSNARQRVTVLANFVEVWVAKERHDGPIGLNLLTTVQMPNLASLYGAMLARVADVRRSRAAGRRRARRRSPTRLRPRLLGLEDGASPMVSKAVKQFARGVAWPELDVLVVDIPPCTGDGPLSLAQAVALSGAVIVTQPPRVAPSSPCHFSARFRSTKRSSTKVTAECRR